MNLYKMGYIISVSLTDEHYHFMKKNWLSPSKLLQDALRQVEAVKNGELLESNASLNAKISRLADNLDKAMNFIKDRGLSDEFLEEKA